MIHQGGVNYWAVFTPLVIFQNIPLFYILSLSMQRWINGETNT